MSTQSSPKPRRANGQGSLYEIKSGPNKGKYRGAVTLPGGKRRTFLGLTQEQVEAKLLELRAPEVTKSRRANGQGTIYEIKSGPNQGKFRCAVTLANGRRRTFLGTSREQVEGKLLDFQHALAHHEPLPPSRTVKVEKYATDWSADRKRSIAPGSWKGEDSNVRNHIVPSLGRKFLVELEAGDMRRLYKDCAERGLAPRSIGYVRGTLRLILDQAVVDGLVQRNVAALVKVPRSKGERFKVTPLSPEEARRFLDAVKDEPQEALYVTTLGLGLRRGEVLGLRWSDISWKKRQVRLLGTTQRIEGEGVRWVPTAKTEGSIATLDVPDFVMDVFLQHRDRHMFLGPKPGDYVFPGFQPGEALDPDKVTKDFPSWLAAHGLRRIRFHDLRHSAASMYLALGVPLWQVSKILRHSSVKITADIYGHLYAETSRAAADTMDAFMAQARGPSGSAQETLGS
jgi:integrase